MCNFWVQWGILHRLWLQLPGFHKSCLMTTSPVQISGSPCLSRVSLMALAAFIWMHPAPTAQEKFK